MSFSPGHVFWQRWRCPATLLLFFPGALRQGEGAGWEAPGISEPERRTDFAPDHCRKHSMFKTPEEFLISRFLKCHLFFFYFYFFFNVPETNSGGLERWSGCDVLFSGLPEVSEHVHPRCAPPSRQPHWRPCKSHCKIDKQATVIHAEA